MSESAAKPRPEFRNIHVSQILKYRMPGPAIVSILHRISGALLFLVGIPFILYLFQQSLTSELSFERYQAVVSHWFAKLVLLGLAWGFLHHLLAGIRFLFLDLHMGCDLPSARKSAAIVLFASLVLTALVGLKIFGVF
ncbi:MAG: succinate dehydrogenase, cytochrome b556 subunit [Pseudomonadota bacterium]|jgi:succinate dehydrogenase / fumarate reductase cytochrome b subunit|nr:succinate dehydrogenase, cytochrome b556 subunit [Pseudomonadota bacterium]